MELKNISKWIVISGTLFIWSVKFGIRPFGDWQQPVKFFLGIAPNLMGAFLIPFGAYWFFSGKDFWLARLFQIQTAAALRQVCLLGFGMLVINEYLQRIPFFGRTFDYYDLLSSALGLVVSYFVFAKMSARHLYRFYPD
jgi:hypothetical protein